MLLSLGSSTMTTTITDLPKPIMQMIIFHVLDGVDVTVDGNRGIFKQFATLRKIWGKIMNGDRDFSRKYIQKYAKYAFENSDSFNKFENYKNGTVETLDARLLQRDAQLQEKLEWYEIKVLEDAQASQEHDTRISKEPRPHVRFETEPEFREHVDQFYVRDGAPIDVKPLDEYQHKYDTEVAPPRRGKGPDPPMSTRGVTVVGRTSITFL